MDAETSPDDKPRASQHLFPVALLLLIAAALRCSRVGYGLPDFLEEAIPLRLALNIRDIATGHLDWNPHSFNYPSLSIYLHFFVQQAVCAIGHLLGAYPSFADYQLLFNVDPTPMVIASRGLSIVADLFAILGVVCIGNRVAPRAGYIAGALCALSPLLITTASSIFSDSIMTACAIWALERLLAWYERRRPRDLLAYAVLAGLAIGAKYPAVALVVPAAFVLWSGRGGVAAIGEWLRTSAIAMLVFFATTPYALLDFGTFRRDTLFESGHAAVGHFGSLQHHSLFFQLSQLTSNLGWLALIVVAFSIYVVVVAPSLRVSLVAIWLALIAFGAPIAFARIDAARYVVPVLYCAALLVGVALAYALQRWGTRLPRPAVALGMLLILATPIWGAATLIMQRQRTTQLVARDWCEKHLPDSALIVQEGYSARLPTVLQKERFRSENAYVLAGPAARRRFDSIRPFHCVTIPLKVAGSVSVGLPVAGGGTTEVTVLNHSSELNPVFYSPNLYAGADYFMTSSAVRSRFEADTLRYATECAFYRWLDSSAAVIARFDPDRDHDGPALIVYDIAAATRGLEPQALYEPDWWSTVIPERTRQMLASRVSEFPERASRCNPAFAALAPSVRVVSSVFTQYVERFVLDLATEHSLLRRYALAQQLSGVTLTVDPESEEAWFLYCAAAAQLGFWNEVRVASGCAMQTLPAPPEPALQLLHARALARTGATQAARIELEALAARLGPTDPVGAAARQTLATLAGGREKPR
jgi:hypothetical protein